MNNAKKIIDNISSTGVAYEMNHRSTTKCMVLATCTPCIIYSVFVRLVSCPFQCICNHDVGCNPVFACLTDSKITIPSDNCINTAIVSVDSVSKSASALQLTDAEEIEVLKYAANMIKNNTPIIKHRYAIADFVKPIMFKQTRMVNSTPSSVIIAVENIQ